MKIEGYIYDINNNPIAAIVTATHPIDGIIGILQIEPGDKYFIDGEVEYISNLTIVFSSKGYRSITARGSDLIETGPDIRLQKQNTLWLMLIALMLFYILYERKKRVGAITVQEALPLLLIAGSIFAIHIIQKILDKLGLGKDPASGEKVDPGSEWKPDYWKKFTSYSYAINEAQAKQYGATIHDAFTIFQDDFNEIMSVFSAMRTKANVSFLAWSFAKEYNADLLSFLGNGGGILPWDGLSKEHLNTIINLVNSLPNN